MILVPLDMYLSFFSPEDIGPFWEHYKYFIVELLIPIYGL